MLGSRNIFRKLSFRRFSRLISRYNVWKVVLGLICLLGASVLIVVDYHHNEYLVGLFRRDNLKFNLTENYLSWSASKLKRPFLVDNEKCRIPQMSIRDPSIAPLLKVVQPFKCGRQFNLTFVKDQSVIISEKVLQKMGYRDLNDVSCCYKTIDRVQQSEKKFDKEADNGFQYSKKCYPMGKITQPHHGFISVVCENKKAAISNNTIYTNFHIIARFPKVYNNGNIPRKLAFWKECAVEKRGNGSYCDHIKNYGRPPNILLIGLDSTSRLNFHRQMPRSLEYLEKNIGAVEMKGYTKVGENTFPNFVPLMSSFSVDELTKICYPDRWVPQDKCPFIYKEFSKLNYLTALLEDAPRVAAFNYMKTGFINAPTDIYLRPFMLAAYKDKTETAWTRDCIGYQRPEKMILDYIVDLANLAESKGIPYFVSTWLTDLTHEDMNNLQQMDLVVKETLMKLQESGLLDNTVLFLLGDHGYRYTDVRRTAVGWFEDKLPAMFVKIPENLTKQHPSWLEGLKHNSHQLTTPFNIHATMKEILRTIVIQSHTLLNDTITANEIPSLSQLAPNILQSKSTFPSHTLRDLSLLEKLPERSCEEAGVPNEYCACQTPVAYTANRRLILLGTEAIVRTINEKLPSVCSPLKIDSIIASAMIVKPTKEQVKSNTSSSPLTAEEVTGEFTDFVFGFKSKPGGYKFEAMATFDAKLDRFMNISSVLRINKNGAGTDCLNPTNISFELVCHCKDKFLSIF